MALAEQEGRRASPPAASLVAVLVSGGTRSLPEGFAVAPCGVGAGCLAGIPQMLKVFSDGSILHEDSDEVL